SNLGGTSIFFHFPFFFSEFEKSTLAPVNGRFQISGYPVCRISVSTHPFSPNPVAAVVQSSSAQWGASTEQKMAFHLLSVPTPHSHSPKLTWLRSPQPPSHPFLLRLSSSSSNSVVETDGLSPPSADGLSETPVQDSATKPFSLSGCKACGKEEIEKGCNGEGRIQGGIATVPGFGWWPIKAYRPCPGFVAAGGRYYRQGQSMDEVVSGGGGGRRVPISTSSPSSSSSQTVSSNPRNRLLQLGWLTPSTTMITNLLNQSALSTF
ncbi:hypothetical protein LINGRAHAP2_LOCUS3011, partial [Linum grandiflorum]